MIENKNIRTLAVLILALVLVVSACGKEKNMADDSDLLIVTSFYPLYVFTSNIADGIPGVKVVNMTEPQTGCLHDYQLVPGDLKTLSKADIFVYNGADMESFLDEVINQLPELKLVEASKDIPLLTDEDGEKNPHVWVSITGGISEVRNIMEGLSEADPANSEKYRKNGEVYIQKLTALKDKMHNELDSITNRDIVTFHEAFPYFAQEFDLNIVSVIEREPGTEPSAGELAKLIETIKKTGVKVLFAEPQYSPKAAESIANQTGAKVYYLDPVVTGPKDAEKDSYERIMEENLNVLKEALR